MPDLSHTGPHPTNLEVNDIVSIRHINMAGFSTASNMHSSPVRPDIVRELKYEFCKNLKRQRRFNCQVGSYGLKHIAEHYIGKYVGNGELITAMIATFHGWRYDNYVNAEFNVTPRSITALAQEAVIRNGWNSGIQGYLGDDPFDKFHRAASPTTEEERRELFDRLPSRMRVKIEGPY